MGRIIFTIKELIDWNKSQTEAQYEIDHQSLVRDINTCRLNDCEKELEELNKALDEADNLLGCSLVFVEDMVGVASAARGLPEEIIEWHNKYKKSRRVK